MQRCQEVILVGFTIYCERRDGNQDVHLNDRVAKQPRSAALPSQPWPESADAAVRLQLIADVSTSTTSIRERACCNRTHMLRWKIQEAAERL